VADEGGFIQVLKPMILHGNQRRGSLSHKVVNAHVEGNECAMYLVNLMQLFQISSYDICP
jgi:hypothetical protein